MKDKYKNPVSMYQLNLSCQSEKLELKIKVLAIDSDWAMTFVNRDVDWDVITIRKLSGKIALANYGARCIEGETEEFYLNYHACPYMEN